MTETIIKSKSKQNLNANGIANQEDKILQQRKGIDQIQKLTKDIRSACQKNRFSYNKIIKYNPFYNHNLYNPPLCLNTKKSQINLTRNLLIKQLDNLLEEQNKFQRQLNKIQIRQQQQKFSKQCHLQKHLNHFLFLRNVWKRNIVAADSEDRIQKLNKSVALIKGHIMTLTKKENSQSINNQAQTQKQLIVNSRQYLQLKEKVQKLMMQRQQFIQMKRNNLSVNNEEVMKLQDENRKLRSQLSQQKQKIKILQKNNLIGRIKIQQLQQQIYQKQRIIHKHNKQIKIVYKNQTQDFKIQILSKSYNGKEEKLIPKTLQQVIQDIQSLKINIKAKSQESDQQNTFNNQQTLNNRQLNKKLTLTERTGSIFDTNSRSSHRYSPNSKPLIDLKYQKQQPDQIRINGIGQRGTSNKRLKSISDKNSKLQVEVKKARFVRTGTRTNLDDFILQTKKGDQRENEKGNTIKISNQQQNKVDRIKKILE